MIYSAVLTFVILLPLQDSRRAATRQSRPAPQVEKVRVEKKRRREGTLPADFGKGAPGRAVIGQKWLPITNAPYCNAEQAKRNVRDKDIVIGIRKGEKAYCYPINMLGGPQREIINEEIDGEPFAINW